jgi:hypothetical protein
MFRRFAYLTALLWIAVGCNSLSDPATTTVFGTFNLQTFNGSSLPVTVSLSGNTRVELESDVFSVNPDGTWSELAYYLTTTGATVTASSAAFIGVYRALNAQIQFTVTTPTTGTFSGSVSGNTLTIVETNGTWVYQR